MGKGKKASATKASNGAPAADTALHGETLQMIQVGAGSCRVASINISDLAPLMGSLEEARTPSECAAGLGAHRPSLVR